MKKLTLKRETLQRLDLDAARGGLPVTTTHVQPEPQSAYQMTCQFSCLRTCDFTTKVPL